MIEFIKRVSKAATTPLRASLPWDKRIKSRLRLQLENGEEAGIFLKHGSVLRGGDLLASNKGDIVEIVAAPETVSTVTSDDPLLLARLCYHLGNRHIALQISARQLSFQHDHVLDEMVQQLGGIVSVQKAPFEPEHGAYSSGHGHSRSHHSHD